MTDNQNFTTPDGEVENTWLKEYDIQSGLKYQSEKFSSDLRLSVNISELGIPEGEEGHDDHGDHDDHDDHEGHNHGKFDPHIWLDPINAKIILNEMVEHLIENDAKNASTYKSNLDKALKDIDKLTMEVMTELNQSTSSIVFHDAYQYFEERFNVNVLGAFTVNTDVMPGAEQLA